MPNVKMPDGTLVAFPDDMSREEIRGLIAKKFPDAVAQTPPAEAAMPSQGADPAPQKPGRVRSGARTAMQGLTWGAGDEIQAGMAALPIYALKNLFTGDKVTLGQAYDFGLDRSREELKQARDAYPVQSFATEVAGAIPTGGTAFKTAGRVAPKTMGALSNFARTNPVKTGAALGFGGGATYGFAEGEGGAGGRTENALRSGAFAIPFGAGGGYIASKFGSRGSGVVGDRVSDEIFKKMGVTDRLGKGNTSQKSALARLTPEQRERSRVLEAAGVPADKQTAGMISREPRQWQFEQNTKGIAGVGDDIQNRYVQANQMIKEKLNQVKNVTGGRATTPYEAGESVTGAITKKNREMQEDIGKLYGRIREEVGDDVGLRPERILEALDVAGDNAYADNIVNSLTRKMKRYGVLDKSGNAVEEASLSVKNAEELRKFANSLRGDRQTENIVTDLINALDDDVIETAGGDAFKEARDVARDRFREFETKILKNITDERLVSDDVLRRTVYGGKVKDLQALKQSLLSGTEEQTARGAQAWNDLKLQTIQSMLDKAEGSGGKVSGTQFKRQLERIGKERLDTVFDPQELLQLRTIEKALEYTTIEVPESVVNYSGTAAANANNVLGGIVKQTSTTGNILERTGEGLSRVPLIGQTPFVASGIKNAGETMNKAATRRAVKQSVNPARALKKLADPGVVGKTSISSGILGERMGDNYE